eukprot:scaffold90443_cov20-Tisochrysis_lutea.AAC.2
MKSQRRAGMSTSGFADDFADDVADLVDAAGVSPGGRSCFGLTALSCMELVGGHGCKGDCATFSNWIKLMDFGGPLGPKRVNSNFVGEEG